MLIVLPWPPRACSPNARVHWAVKARVAKAYRKACWALAVQAGIKAPPDDGPIELQIEFVPPNRRRFDQDNLVSSIKNGLDGLADAMGVNDRRFRLAAPVVSDEIGGMVRVRVDACAAAPPMASSVLVNRRQPK